MLKVTSLDRRPTSHRDVGDLQRCLTPAPFTKEMFFEEYGKGLNEISSIACPNCLRGTTFLKAPEAFYESKRLQMVAIYKEKPQWQATKWFNEQLKQLMALENVGGASISLVDAKLQLIKAQYGLGYTQCSRQVSLTAHAILSKGSMTLLDATKDWRTEDNPVVKNVPFIRYYCAVPLLAKGQAIGCIEIFDSFARDEKDSKTILAMQRLASDIMKNLNGNYLELQPVPRQEPLSRFGRATGSILEDSSTHLYQHIQGICFSKYFYPYEDVIDLNIWRQLLPCHDMRTASQLLARIFTTRLDFQCVYFVQLQVSEPGRIRTALLKEREIQVTNRLQIERPGPKDTRSKLLGIQSSVQGVDNQWMSAIHLKAYQSAHGYRYESDSGPIQSGLCLPYHRLPEKAVRRRKSTGEFSDVYIRSGGYMVCCFCTKPRPISDEELGYIYGCSSILRRMFLMTT